MLWQLLGGMSGVLLGLCLFLLGRFSMRETKQPTAAPALSEEEQRRVRRSMQELTNFYAYDGTMQEDQRTDLSR